MWLISERFNGIVHCMKILILEDDFYTANELKRLLSPYGSCFVAKNLEELVLILKDHQFDMATIDLSLEGSLGGLKALKLLPKTYCFILSSHNDESLIEKSYDLGCKHYLDKIKFQENLPSYIECYINDQNQGVLDSFFENTFITKSQALKKEIKGLFDLFKSDRPFLITGPTGVGKTILAQWVHEISRADHKLVEVNFSELSKGVVESELFGHRRGAFTDAKEKKVGLLEMANEGTLFMDEIGTISIDLQKKLLKIIEEKKYTPVGGEKRLKSNFRPISATCDDLIDLIGKGEMRKDFYYRLNGFSLYIPPLKERKEDIPLLLNHFRSKQFRKFIFAQNTIDCLMEYEWPGNVRELSNFVKSIARVQKGKVEIEDLPKYMIRKNANNFSYEFSTKQIQLIRENGLRSFVKELEKEAVKDALEYYQGNKKKAIGSLRISNSAFYRILEEIGIHGN